MRLALFGSPAFAVPTLEQLIIKHDIALVVTQPDKPVGRGLKVASPPLAMAAKALGLRLEQPTKLKTNEAFHDLLKELQLDAAITAAYGKLLPQSLLEIPKHGFLNVHGSLLPKYRGAAPIQWALINGESETGITIMQTEAGLDSGPIRYIKTLNIEAQDTSLSLFEKLATLGATAIDEALELLQNNALPSTPQNALDATLAPLLTKDDGIIRWEDSSTSIYNCFRGVLAWPGSWTLFRNEPLKIIDLEKATAHGSAGKILEVSKDGVLVAASEGSVLLKTVQPANKPKMPAYDWANGYLVKTGDRFEG
jgi:methionyl-tRNA formyltransferase